MRFDWYDNEGEPGILGAFSFTESNLEITSPEWYFVSIGTISNGTDIVVMTTKAAKVYLVPEGTEPDTTSIKEAAVAIMLVLAYTQSRLATSGLTLGNYVVFAIDNSNNISKKIPLITLQTTVNTAVISNNSEISVTYNPAYKLISITAKTKSNKLMCTIF